MKNIGNIVVTADVQAHMHQQYASVEDGINSRLKDATRCLYQAVDLAGKEGILVINGDLFHDRESIDISVLDEVAKWRAYAADHCKETIITAGNHDHYTRLGNIHSLRSLWIPGKITIVGDEPYCMKHGDLNLAFHAFSEDLGVVRSWMRSIPKDHILFLHQDVIGATMDGGRTCDIGLSLHELTPYRHVFLGHFHKPQDLADNVQYVGSPYQITRGEEGQKKRFLIMDQSGKVSEHIVSGMPEFRTITVPDFMELLKSIKDKDIIDPNYYTVIHNADEKCEISGDIPIKYKTSIISTPPDPDSETTQEKSVGTFNPQEALRKWLSNQGREDLMATALDRLHA